MPISLWSVVVSPRARPFLVGCPGVSGRTNSAAAAMDGSGDSRVLQEGIGGAAAPALLAPSLPEEAGEHVDVGIGRVAGVPFQAGLVGALGDAVAMGPVEAEPWVVDAVRQALAAGVGDGDGRGARVGQQNDGGRQGKQQAGGGPEGDGHAPTSGADRYSVCWRDLENDQPTMAKRRRRMPALASS